ncbi:MAG: hypothetical protein WKF85_02225 [Chitinophagaceae bacterium]
MPLYIDKKVEDYEHELLIVQLKKGSLQSNLDFEKDIKERENLQLKIDLLSDQILKLEKTISTYYPKYK